ncbi:spore germination protein [Neobacillus vireti]|uniref:spore germination protein n=1 Tax=Neobacillus vireti TaxID=220686 RepID=UPI0030001868
MRSLFQSLKKIMPQNLPSKPNKQVVTTEKYIDKNLEENLTLLKNIFRKTDDILYREFEFLNQKTYKVFICYLDGIVNDDYINLNILKPLMEPNFSTQHFDQSSLPTIIRNRILHTTDIQELKKIDQVIDSVLTGKTVLFIDGFDSALAMSTQGFETRNVTEPDTESSVRGSREGFNEVLKVNTALIRRKINNPSLRFEKLKLGKQTRTNIRIGYIEGIANEKVVDEVRTRLQHINVDSILESGYLEQFIEDSPFSIFPTVGNSEKPDKVASKLLEGRVAILCDGTPFVLTVPFLFVEGLQVGEDYYSRPYLSSLIRLLRLLALFIAIAVTPFYIALTTYHQEMVPSLLLATMAAGEERVPFPIFIETLLMEITFQLLREAGVRMPRPVGSAISIVGALVIGEGAVQAGLVSSAMVISIAITGIAGFVVPAFNDAIILSKILLLILAGSFGLYGILMGFMVILGHLCSLRSLGTPYLTPQAPIIWSEWKDSIIRLPLWLFKSRPQSITWEESKRSGFGNKPSIPDKDEREG